MKESLRLLTAVALVVLVHGRTVEREPDAELVPNTPMGPAVLASFRPPESESSLNAIRGGLPDKYEKQKPTTPKDVPTPTVPDNSYLQDSPHPPIRLAEELEGDPEDNSIEGSVDSFPVDIFDGENDMTVMMKLMYGALDSRLRLLKSRVRNVEFTAGQVLRRLNVFDCSDMKAEGKRSGAYMMYLEHQGKRPVKVLCDMDTDGGGWTVIQRRLPYPTGISFNRGWHDYKLGFGDVSSDFWVGLENIYVWTNARHYELRIELTDYNDGEAFAQYDRFYVDSESQGYRLHVEGYTGTAGDSLGNEGTLDNFTADGMMFTTQDEDHDTSHEINCAKYWKIGGWWYNRCSWANLNGPHREPSEGEGIGINWHKWRNKEYLRSAKMMIRPVKVP